MTTATQSTITGIKANIRDTTLVQGGEHQIGSFHNAFNEVIDVIPSSEDMALKQNASTALTTSSDIVDLADVPVKNTSGTKYLRSDSGTLSWGDAPTSGGGSFNLTADYEPTGEWDFDTGKLKVNGADVITDISSKQDALAANQIPPTTGSGILKRASSGNITVSALAAADVSAINIVDLADVPAKTDGYLKSSASGTLSWEGISGGSGGGGGWSDGKDYDATWPANTNVNTWRKLLDSNGQPYVIPNDNRTVGIWFFDSYNGEQLPGIQMPAKKLRAILNTRTVGTLTRDITDPSAVISFTIDLGNVQGISSLIFSKSSDNELQITTNSSGDIGSSSRSYTLFIAENTGGGGSGGGSAGFAPSKVYTATWPANTTINTYRKVVDSDGNDLTISNDATEYLIYFSVLGLPSVRIPGRELRRMAGTGSIGDTIVNNQRNGDARWDIDVDFYVGNSSTTAFVKLTSDFKLMVAGASTVAVGGTPITATIRVAIKQPGSGLVDHDVFTATDYNTGLEDSVTLPANWTDYKRVKVLSFIGGNAGRSNGQWRTNRYDVADLNDPNIDSTDDIRFEGNAIFNFNRSTRVLSTGGTQLVVDSGGTTSSASSSWIYKVSLNH